MSDRMSPTLAAMRAARIQETRENFIYWLFDGEPPGGEIDPEIEAELPFQFRREALDELLTDKIQ
jgi:hypothetical protein